MYDRRLVEADVRDFILSEFLNGEDPSLLTNDTALISAGIIDSIGTLKLVAFLENRFDISLSAHEATSDRLDTVNLITELVLEK